MMSSADEAGVYGTKIARHSFRPTVYFNPNGKVRASHQSSSLATQEPSANGVCVCIRLPVPESHPNQAATCVGFISPGIPDVDYRLQTRHLRSSLLGIPVVYLVLEMK